MEDSDLPFLKRLPFGLAKSQRIMLEAIDVACDMIDVDWHEITEKILFIIEDAGDNQLEPIDRLKIIRAAWSIVDRMDSIRQTLLILNRKIHIPIPEHQRSLLQAARVLRNKMAHLGSSAEQHGKSHHDLPIFGILSFNWNNKNDVTFDNGHPIKIIAQCATFLSASLFHDGIKMDANEMMSDNVYPVFGNVNFFAFGNKLNMSECKLFADDLRCFLNESLEPILMAWVENSKILKGEDMKNAMHPVYEPFQCTVWKMFGEPVLIERCEVHPKK